MIYLISTFVVIIAFSLFVSLCVRRRLSVKRVGILLVATLVSPFVINEAYQYHWYAKAIPAEIGITYAVSSDDETGFREGCGTTVFKLSDGIVDFF